MKLLYKHLILLFVLSLNSVNLNAQDRDKLINDYISEYADEAVKEMLDNKIPASITLSQGLFESGFGKSRLATEANNHFGIKCHKTWTGERIYHDDDEKGECFRKYTSAQQSYYDHSQFLRSRDRYSDLFLLKLNDYKGWAKGLKKAGYATNPKYADRIISIIEEFELYHFDTLTSLAAIPNMIKKSSLDSIIHPKVDETMAAQKDTIEKNISSGEFIVMEKRSVKSHNRIKYIEAHEDESLQSIALEFDVLSERLLRKYNDLNEETKITEGMRIYLQPKRKKCQDKDHFVMHGETLWYISQKYGIKLSKLANYNQMKIDDLPEPGTKVKLR